MSCPAVFLPEAEEDIDQVYSYYEAQRVGLGEEFLKQLQATLERVRDNVLSYAVVHRDVRAAPLRRFPYVVFYRVRIEDVLVIAVQHGRRSDRAWKRRV